MGMCSKLCSILWHSLPSTSSVSSRKKRKHFRSSGKCLRISSIHTLKLSCKERKKSSVLQALRGKKKITVLFYLSHISSEQCKCLSLSIQNYPQTFFSRYSFAGILLQQAIQSIIVFKNNYYIQDECFNYLNKMQMLC